MIPTHFITAIAAAASLVSALPSYHKSASLDLVPRQDNCTLYSSPVAGVDRRICPPYDCNAEYLVQEDENCIGIAEKLGTVSTSILRYFNPQIGNECNLLWDVPICVGTPWYDLAGGPIQYPEKSIISTDGLSPLLIPVPAVRGAIDTCNRWYLIAEGQTAYDVSVDAGVEFGRMYDWNTLLDNEGSFFWTGSFACVGVSEGTEVPSNTTRKA